MTSRPLSRAGSAAQIAGAKYLSESLKDKRKLLGEEAKMDATVIGAQSKLVQGSAEASRDSAESQAEATRQSAYGQIEGGASQTTMAAAAGGASIHGSVTTSGLSDEAALNQDMADRLRKEPELGATRLGASQVDDEASSTDLDTRGEGEAPRTQEEAKADLHKLFGKGSAAEKDRTISKTEGASKKGGLLESRKLADEGEYAKAADRVTDKETREEYAKKFEKRAEIQRNSAAAKRKSSSDRAQMANTIGTGIAGITQGAAGLQAANSQAQKGQADAAKDMFQGTEQSRQGTQKTIDGQTESARQDLKQQVEMMRKTAQPN